MMDESNHCALSDDRWTVEDVMRKITRTAGTLFAATALAAVLAPAAGAATTPARPAAMLVPSSAAGYWNAVAENGDRVTFAADGGARSVAQESALAACQHSPRTDDPDSCHIISTTFRGG